MGADLKKDAAGVGVFGRLDAVKKKPLISRSFFLSQKRLECIIQGYGPGIIVVIIFCVLNVECIFTMECYILLENYIAEYIPELEFLVFLNAVKEVGSIIGCAAKVSIVTNSVVCNIQIEAARLCTVQRAVAKACLPSAVSFVSIGIPVFAKYAEIMNRNYQVCTPDAVKVSFGFSLISGEVEICCAKFCCAEVISQSAKSNISCFNSVFFSSV